MPKKTFAIMGATGHIGHVIAEKLVEIGYEVRVLGRDPGKLSALGAKGAKPLTVVFDDARALTGAFRGADGVFVMIPPSYGEDDFSAYQDRVIEAVEESLVATGVKYAIDLSSIGAGQPSGTGPITGLYRMEQSLNRLTHVNVLHLRASSFMENQYWSIPVIKANGINASTAPGDFPMPTVATRDIGEKAAEFLAKLSFKGHEVFEFTGPKEYTLTEVTTALGKAIGLLMEKQPKKIVPYITGISQASLENLKSFCASIATYGGTALFHLENITPEAAQMAPPTQCLVISQADIDAAIQSMTSQGAGEVDFVSLGCPHLSIREIARIAELVQGKRVRREFWVTTARPTKLMADRMGYTRIIEESGAKFAADTCCVVAPIKGRFHTLATDSAKACYYAYAKNKFNIRLMPFDEVVAEALK